jgi:hypothetical protein
MAPKPLNTLIETTHRMKTYIRGMHEISSSNGILLLFTFLTDFLKIRNKISKTISCISRKYKSEDPGESYKKYLDSDLWIYECLLRFYRLNLHKLSREINILDLGTGAGYFPYICRFYGHNVDSIDILDNEMYNEIINAFGLRRYGQYITYYSPLTTLKRYDYITAFMICFNQHKKSSLWHISEWEAFLSNLKKNNLSTNGQIYLSFNAESVHEPVSKKLLAYFQNRNAEIVNSSTVHIGPNYAF